MYVHVEHTLIHEENQGITYTTFVGRQIGGVGRQIGGVSNLK